MVVLIFDTLGGLCNQFYDVLCGVNFAIQHKLPFTFRYCMSRTKDMKKDVKLEMHELFDMEYFKTLPLYKDYVTIKDDMKPSNTYNWKGQPIHLLLDGNKNIYTQICAIKITYKYIVLPFFHTVHRFQNIKLRLYNQLKPAPSIMSKYMKIKQSMGLVNGQYNYIHYRYEADFINHFQIKDHMSLSTVLNKVKFKDNTCKTYIASSNVATQLYGCDEAMLQQILYKNEEDLRDLGYEECAFIDFMIGKYSKEVWGNRRSSFSGVLNSLHQTNNFYC